MDDLLTKLAEPFAPDAITWKPGATKDNKCLALAYADLRAYQDRLDEVCGLDWAVRYAPWNERRIICELTIHGVTRSSTGEYDAQDEKNNMGGTVAEAQAMKRAAAQFGLGRYLYDLPSVWVEFDSQRKRISDAGQAELDKRYQQWYARKMASSNASQATETPQDVIFGNMAHDSTTPPEAPRFPPASESTLKRMHVLGVQFHGSKEQWDAARQKWVESASKGSITSSNDLLQKEAEWIIASLEKRIAERSQEKEKVSA